jgi:hypothetical protein
VAEGNLDNLTNVTRAQEQAIDRRAAFCIGGFSGAVDRINADQAEAGATWQDWAWGEGTIIAAARTDFSGSSSGNKVLFFWGLNVGVGNTIQTHNQLRMSSADGDMRYVTFYRDGSTVRTWQRQFDSGAVMTTGESYIIVLTHDGSASGPKLYIDGVEITSFTDADNDVTDTVGPESFFDTVQTLIDPDAFKCGPYRSDQGWVGSVISHIVFDDAEWTAAQVEALQTACDASKAYTAPGELVTVTIGQIGVIPNVSESGFLTGSHGSVSGSLPFTSAIRELNWDLNSPDPSEFIFECEGVVAQDAFRYLTMETTRGFYRQHTALATYSNPGGTRSRWVWTASNDYWRGLSVSDTARVWFKI